MKTFPILLFLSFIAAAACTQKNKKVDTEVVYDAPDQVLWHAKSKTWFVSNLGGGISLQKDGYGWITRLDQSGEVLDAQWIKGLDAPSGMISTDEKLFVCDRAGVYQIDIAQGKIEAEFPLLEGEFINDVCISKEGDLYVSDFFANKIYRIPATTRQPEVFLELDESPDGLYMDQDTLVVVTWGVLSDKATFETSRMGKVLLVDLETKELRPLLNDPVEIGNLEGITKAGDGAYYVTDWMNGTLLKITSAGVETVLSGLKNPTDPDYSPELNVVAFPEHNGNRVIFYHVGADKQ